MLKSNNISRSIYDATAILLQRYRDNFNLIYDATARNLVEKLRRYRDAFTTLPRQIFQINYDATATDSFAYSFAKMRRKHIYYVY